MVQLLAGKDQIQVKSYEKYLLILSNEMLALIESRLILIEDIQKVIEHAETSQERFIDQESGHTLAYFRPNLITYWVEYTPEGKGYQIHDAYSHRMEFGGDASV
jgi:glutamate synthase (NADPH/NADH) small chain